VKKARVAAIGPSLRDRGSLRRSVPAHGVEQQQTDVRVVKGVGVEQLGAWSALSRLKTRWCGEF
jgi:hypothetical protein